MPDSDKSSFVSTKTVNDILNLTSRIDERVKMLLEKQKRTEEKLDVVGNEKNNVLSRVALLEGLDMKDRLDELEEKLDEKLDALERTLSILKDDHNALSIKSINVENKWNKVLDTVFKLGFIVFAAYLLYKLGLSPPPL